jgi:hypothetical protein
MTRRVERVQNDKRSSRRDGIIIVMVPDGERLCDISSDSPSSLRGTHSFGEMRTMGSVAERFLKSEMSKADEGRRDANAKRQRKASERAMGDGAFSFSWNTQVMEKVRYCWYSFIPFNKQ